MTFRSPGNTTLRAARLRCVTCLVGLFLLSSVGCTRRPAGTAFDLRPWPVGNETEIAAAREGLDRSWPPEFRAVQRVIITVGRKQYVTDGLLTASPSTGLHLAVISPLGLVTEVACSADGQSEVLRTTPLFPEDWARTHVARDLCWLFRPASGPLIAQQLPDGRLALETLEPGPSRRYVWSAGGTRVEEFEAVEGGRRIYHARFGGWREFAPWPRPLPTTLQVDAGRYQLLVRIVQLDLPADSEPEP
jgi:hypothetical protein